MSGYYGTAGQGNPSVIVRVAPKNTMQGSDYAAGVRGLLGKGPPKAVEGGRRDYLSAASAAASEAFFAAGAALTLADALFDITVWEGRSAS